MIGKKVWIVLCLILLSFVVIGGVCTAEESEQEAPADVNAEVAEVYA